MGKSQFPNTFNWQSTDPALTFNPQLTTAGNSAPSGNASGAMAATNTIYSNILGLGQTDSQGLEVNWTGTPTGVLSVKVSNSGKNFYSLTFSPAIAQPAGSAAGEVIALQQIPFRFMYLVYTNTSGTGVLTAWGQQKAFNN